MKKLLIGLSLIIFSCSPKHHTANFSFVPKNTRFVTSLNIASLVKKANLDPSFYNKLTKGFNKKEKKVINDIIANPDKLGIDYNTDFVIFKPEESTNISFSLKDPKKFINFMENETTDRIKFKKEGNYFKGSTKSSGKTDIVVSDKVVLFYNGEDEILNLTKNETIESNKQFVKFYKKQADIAFWFPYDRLSSSRKKRKLQELGILFGQQFEDSSIGIYLNFNQKNINLNWNVFQGETLKKNMVNGVLTKIFNTNLLKFLPQKSYFSTVMSFNPEKYVQALKRIKNFEKGSNKDFQKTGYTFSELFTSLKGSVAIGLYDKNSKPVVSFVFDYKNNDKVFALLKSVVGDLKQEGDFYYGRKGRTQAITNTKTKIALITETGTEMIDSFKQGGFKNNLTSISSKIKSKSLFMNFDVDLDKNVFLKKTRQKKIIRKLADFVKNIELESSTPLSFDIIVNTRKTDGNSLKQLVEFIEKVAK